ncbi:hypothetical protein AWM68_12785 [Fictibacillus phosphorivorans]|uniref:VTT domain-containing protein n=1 Tax=Fictibacillus phosphorivorans TaxID=1221500 RepID=A0A163PQX0_9BACL|nr:VTT domain-containing protein [Fictibacillus phosphorivorans]KZE63981.1 hypothetical protein AWM68_12785 [Fictibacillus phosphorivorans]
MNLKSPLSSFSYKLFNPYTYPVLKQLGMLIISILLLSQTLSTFESSYRIIGFSIGYLLMVTLLVSHLLRQRTIFEMTKTGSIVYSLFVLSIYLTHIVSSMVVLLDNKGLESILNENIELAKFIYFMVCFAQPIILPVPEMVTVVAGSAALGSLSAFILGFLGAVLGILTMFYLSRTFGMKVVQRLVNEKQLEQYHRSVRKNEMWILGLLFIIPVLPDEIICVGAGISGVKANRFITIALLSKLVTTFSLAYSLQLTDLF